VNRKNIGGVSMVNYGRMTQLANYEVLSLYFVRPASSVSSSGSSA